MKDDVDSTDWGTSVEGLLYYKVGSETVYNQADLA
jgi:hypothetical protein